MVGLVALAAVGCGASPAAVESKTAGDTAALDETTESAGRCEMEPAVDYDGPIPIERVNVDSIQASEGSCDPSEIVRRALEAELAAFDWNSERIEGSFRLTATVLELSTEEAASGVVSHSTVSTTLLHDKQGLVAALRGSAQAEDAPAEGERAEQAALDAAARGSLRNLPQALRSVY